MQYYRSDEKESYKQIKGYIMAVAGFFGIALYSYGHLITKKDDFTELSEKDYEKLTARQIKKREEYQRVNRDFDRVLDKLQDKLKNEYQEQLQEFQQYVKDKQSKS